MKVCTRCREEKPLDAFGTRRGTPDGKQYYCRACIAEYRRDNYDRMKEGRNASSRKWNRANADKMREARKRYYRTHPEFRKWRKEYQRRWYHANAEHVKEYRWAYRERKRQEQQQGIAA